MQRLRRWRFEVFLALLAAAEVASVATADIGHKAGALVVTALSVAVLAGRRWQPLAATVAAFAALTVGLAIMPRSTTAQFFGTLATFAIAGAVNREREAMIAWLAGAGMLGYASWVDPFGGGTPDFLLSLAFGTTMWGAGLLVARRGRHVRDVLRQAEEAEREREAQTRRALAEERATIARELHDVVSHGLSVVIVQTLAARSVLGDVRDAAAGKVDRHLDAVESTARDALAEMRRMLGLLHSVSDDTGTASPAPGLRHLEELVDRVAPGQARIQLHVDDGIELPPGLELAVYRIVQEALTNVVKHAPGSAVDVTVRRSHDHLTVTVANGSAPDPPAHAPVGGGRGLIGIRERAALYGGTVDAGPTPDGGFAVTATFPVNTHRSVPESVPHAPSKVSPS